MCIFGLWSGNNFLMKWRVLVLTLGDIVAVSYTPK